MPDRLALDDATSAALLGSPTQAEAG